MNPAEKPQLSQQDWYRSGIKLASSLRTDFGCIELREAERDFWGLPSRVFGGWQCYTWCWTLASVTLAVTRAAAFTKLSSGQVADALAVGHHADYGMQPTLHAHSARKTTVEDLRAYCLGTVTAFDCR